MTLTPVAVVDRALAAIQPYERAELEARLRHARVRLLDEQVRVLVVGEFKQGKSMLVNGLVSAPVCPVSDDIATSVPAVVRHADAVTVTLVRRLGDDPVNPDAPEAAGIERVEIPAEELPAHLGEAGRREGLVQVEIGVPRPILAGGLEIVDTPGVGGLSSVHGAATTATLPTADAVLLVSDASQEYTAPELEFLSQAAAVCPNVACVLTKNDLYPEWRRIAEIDKGHLAKAGIRAELFAVSSTLRWQAVLGDDAELNDESGYPDLVRYLRRNVVGQADRLARRSVVHDVLTVTGQLAGGLHAELAAQQDPEAAGALVGQLTEARQRASDLQQRAARWQQTLNDGVADLNADIDHDLRGRMREITRIAEEELGGAEDPTPTWDQFTRWVQQEVAGAAAANFVWATQRARWLGERVAEHFSDESDQVLPALRTDASDALRSVRPIAVRGDEKWTTGQKMFTGVKGGYFGVLMFGMVGSLIGIGFIAIAPLGITAGVLMGRKAIGDERKRIITKRQNEARAAVRRYVDDVTFQVGKDSRDRLRGVQRDLRDHFTEQAEQMKRSLQESLTGAERAVNASAGERERRLPEIRAQLEQLEAVRREARELLAAPKPDHEVAPAPAAVASG